MLHTYATLTVRSLSNELVSLCRDFLHRPPIAASGNYQPATMSETTTPVRSWVYTTPSYPDTLALSTIDVPFTPSPGHILLRVRATSLNPVDIQLMNLPLHSLPYLNGPKVPTRDFVGTVLAAAKDTEFQEGDEVYGITLALDGTGFLTEVAHVDTKKACIIKKPKHLSWTQAKPPAYHLST